MRHLSLAVLMCVLSLQGARADEVPKPRVLILPYRVAAGVPVSGDTCNAILSARLGKLDAFHIVSQQELESMALYQAQLMALGEADDPEALRNLGRAASAERLVSGTLGNVGGVVAATLTLINVDTGEVEKRVSGTAKGEPDLILPLLNQQADALLAHLIRTYSPERLHAAKAPVAPAVPVAKAASPQGDNIPATGSSPTVTPGLVPATVLNLVGAVFLLAGVGAVGFSAGTLLSAVVAGFAFFPHGIDRESSGAVAGMMVAGVAGMTFAGVALVGALGCLVASRTFSFKE